MIKGWVYCMLLEKTMLAITCVVANEIKDKSKNKDKSSDRPKKWFLE